MRTYRVAILGCRSRGTAAARAYHAHPRCQIVGLCDLVRERVDTLGDELGIPDRFTDLDELMRGGAPDIVAIPTATEFHHELCMRVLAYGAHIDVEKPMCSTLEQADEVLAEANRKGFRIAVHHQGRCSPSMRAAQRAIREGRIGAIRYLTGTCKGYYGGYGLMNIGTHIVNNMIGLVGHCRSVTALGLTAGDPVTPADVIPSAGGMGTVCGERLTALLAFGDNITGTLVQHRYARVDNTAYGLEIYGEEGRIFWKSTAGWLLPTPHYVPDGVHDHWEALSPVYADTFDPSGRADASDYAYVDEFVRALDEDHEHECSGGEGLHVMETLMGVLESAAYGRRVMLPQTDRRHPLLHWREVHGMDAPASMPRDYREWLEAEDRRLGRPPAQETA
ncbi:MAG: Gfo/Idh/MocA family oxidoreductase [candidate division Zixibacteria bacterium]|nr:Gfo/Idh/MocA family oxidoreductase [candidate division Zixibacteria bacterium]